MTAQNSPDSSQRSRLPEALIDQPGMGPDEFFCALHASAGSCWVVLFGRAHGIPAAAPCAGALLAGWLCGQS